MTVTSWGWVAWIVVALVSWLVIAVLGAVNGIRILALDRSSGLVVGIRNPLFLLSWLTRVGIALGVIFLMTVKPGAVVAGVLRPWPRAAGGGTPSGPRARRPPVVGWLLALLRAPLLFS